MNDPKKPKKLSSTELRVYQAALDIGHGDGPTPIVFQHTVFCQTGLPYRDPGDLQRWERTNGHVSLLVERGSLRAPDRTWVQQGYPFGPKPRLILAYLSTQAIQQQSPIVQVEATLSSFLKRLGFSNDGRNYRVFLDQLARLSAAKMTLGVDHPDKAGTYPLPIVGGFEVWREKDENQRLLWEPTVTFSSDYFKSLMVHAVPLDERALVALSNNAMALDIYSWLAQRLHRVHAREEAFITWVRLKEQFGQDYAAMFKFKQVFRHTLEKVVAVYPTARLGLDGHGMTLRNSPPPVLRKTFQIPRSK